MRQRPVGSNKRQGGLETIDGRYEALSQRFGYRIITPENIVNRLGYWAS